MLFILIHQRITGRRICSSCGATYNVLTGVNTPKKENTCDRCGSSLYQREDDNLASFQVRYQTFIDKTYPLIEFYRERGVLYEVKSISPEDTFNEVKEIIHDND